MGATVIFNDEKDFRKHTIRLAEAFEWHVSHIEAHESAAGIPDLSIYPGSMGKPRAEVWLELKVIKDGHIKLRPTQKRWHRERHEAGGRSWVAVLDRSTGDILVVRGHVAAGLDSRAPSWRAAAIVSNIESTNWLFNLVIENERKHTRDSDRTQENTGSAEAALSAGGQNVGGDHWLTSKS